MIRYDHQLSYRLGAPLCSMGNPELNGRFKFKLDGTSFTNCGCSIVGRSAGKPDWMNYSDITVFHYWSDAFYIYIYIYIYIIPKWPTFSACYDSARYIQILCNRVYPIRNWIRKCLLPAGPNWDARRMFGNDGIGC